jgi:hypothetical protein
MPYVTMEYTAKLADIVGPDRILLDADDPFRIGDMKPLETVTAAAGIGAGADFPDECR